MHCCYTSLVGSLGRTHSINKFLQARAALAAKQRELEAEAEPPPPAGQTRVEGATGDASEGGTEEIGEDSS